jgi:hypothetical protein
VKRDTRPADAYPPAPEGLSASSTAIWTALGPTRVKSPERRVLFEQGLRALDRVAAAQATISRDGPTLKNHDTGVMYAHPATRVEKDALFAAIACWRALNLTWNQAIDGQI